MIHSGSISWPILIYSGYHLKGSRFVPGNNSSQSALVWKWSLLIGLNLIWDKYAPFAQNEILVISFVYLLYKFVILNTCGKANKFSSTTPTAKTTKCYSITVSAFHQVTPISKPIVKVDTISFRHQSPYLSGNKPKRADRSHHVFIWPFWAYRVKASFIVSKHEN